MKIFRHLFLLLVLAASGQLGFGVGTAWAEGMFYVSPKVVFGEQKANFGAPSLTVKELPGTGAKPRTPGEFKGQALSSEKGLTFGALAFGLDFHDRFEIPLRLELEVSTRVDAKTKGEHAWYYGDDPNNIHFEDFLGGPNRGLVRIYPKSLSYTMHTAFANLYADWHNETRFTPYIGGGLGVAFINAKASFWSDADSLLTNPPGNIINGGPRDVELSERVTQFAWHLDAGLAYALTDDFALEVGYRYLDVGKDVKFSDKIDQNKYFNPIGVDVELITKGPEKVEFKATHQVLVGFRYTF